MTTRYVIGIDEVGRATAADAARPLSQIHKHISRGSANKFVIGVDEVGRGSLAGPVTVCAAMVPASWTMKIAFRSRFLKRVPDTLFKLEPLRDSKQLSPAAREAWVRYLRACPDVAWAIASESAKTVDRIGIRAAANQAATRALEKLAECVDFVSPKGLTKSGHCAIALVLDAGLEVPPPLVRSLGIRSVRCFPKADERVPAVAVASIFAKVHRDACMRRLHERFPAYGFAAHKGYGTKVHRGAIRRHGLSSMHRETFYHPVGEPRRRSSA